MDNVMSFHILFSNEHSKVINYGSGKKIFFWLQGIHLRASAAKNQKM